MALVFKSRHFLGHPNDACAFTRGQKGAPIVENLHGSHGSDGSGRHGMRPYSRPRNKAGPNQQDTRKEG